MASFENTALFDKTFVGPVLCGTALIGKSGSERHPCSIQPWLGRDGESRSYYLRFSCRCPVANRGGMDGANNKSHGFFVGGKPTCKG
jgi:hypothetical protein